MKTTTIAYFPELNNLEIKTAADFFGQNVAFENVDSLNWSTYFPYKPSCRFKIARSANSIFVHYKIEGNHVKALYTNDQEHPYGKTVVWSSSAKFRSKIFIRIKGFNLMLFIFLGVLYLLIVPMKKRENRIDLKGTFFHD